MKLQAERIEGQNAIARHGPDGVIVNGVAHRQSVIVPWAGAVVEWNAASFDSLTEAHFERLAELTPELVVFGTGPRIRFAKPGLMKALIGRGIGVETMDTAAACRTYTVLVAEGRSVLAALLFEAAPAQGLRP
jgi:uncharacterized protein